MTPEEQFEWLRLRTLKNEEHCKKLFVKMLKDGVIDLSYLPEHLRCNHMEAFK